VPPPTRSARAEAPPNLSRARTGSPPGRVRAARPRTAAATATTAGGASAGCGGLQRDEQRLEEEGGVTGLRSTWTPSRAPCGARREDRGPAGATRQEEGREEPHRPDRRRSVQQRRPPSSGSRRARRAAPEQGLDAAAGAPGLPAEGRCRPEPSCARPRGPRNALARRARLGALRSPQRGAFARSRREVQFDPQARAAASGVTRPRDAPGGAPDSRTASRRP
jgi:hypothetical protein